MLHWCFESRSTGRLTVAQFPNVALVAFVACRTATWLFHPAGAIGSALNWAGTAAIAWWSADEVARGVNPFRRVLGAVVFAAVRFGVAHPGH